MKVHYCVPCLARSNGGPPVCPLKMVIFTVNLLVGLLFSQLLPTWWSSSAMSVWSHVIKICTMFCLSYIMIHVGIEFDIDKSQLRAYGKDYLVAMTAAGFPWIFVALWFIFVLPTPLPWDQALIASRFAAPTSAGILFSMLEASGMKETWLFQKARVLAIFDDLDTILLMIPLKVIVVGLRWELAIDLTFVVALLVLIWVCLHRLKIPVNWAAMMAYAALVTALCELVHFATHDPSIDPLDMIETVHLEVLLPAFAIGCVARSGHTTNLPLPSAQSRASKDAARNKLERRSSILAERVSLLDSATVDTVISSVFMVLVGLSMPPLFGDAAASGGGGGHRLLAAAASDDVAAHGSHASGVEAAASMTPDVLVLHVFAVSVLMVVGKMFPAFCYRDEANLRTRIALSLGMCPRGEVGAGVIVISLGFGIQGPAITVAVICLALNLVASSGFIVAVKALAKEHPAAQGAASSSGAPRKTNRVCPSDDGLDDHTSMSDASSLPDLSALDRSTHALLAVAPGGHTHSPADSPVQSPMQSPARKRPSVDHCTPVVPAAVETIVCEDA